MTTTRAELISPNIGSTLLLIFCSLSWNVVFNLFSQCTIHFGCNENNCFNSCTTNMELWKSHGWHFVYWQFPIQCVGMQNFDSFISVGKNRKRTWCAVKNMNQKLLLQECSIQFAAGKNSPWVWWTSVSDIEVENQCLIFWLDGVC